MQIGFQVKMNKALYLRDPETSGLGREMIRKSIELINEIGYENFTFKKLASVIPTTEASVYRYFENKHKLLIYLVDLYWAFVEFQVIFKLNNIHDPEEKIKKIIDLLVWEDNEEQSILDIDQKALYYIAIAEGSKTYLAKNIDDLNREMLFKPFKDLCSLIANAFLDYKPGYPYAKTLASSLVEMSHFQYFFMQHLPRLCDFSEKKDPKELEAFLEHFVFQSLK
jgi:AcrR family transcriptional regulator